MIWEDWRGRTGGYETFTRLLVADTNVYGVQWQSPFFTSTYVINWHLLNSCSATIRIWWWWWLFIWLKKRFLRFLHTKKKEEMTIRMETGTFWHKTHTLHLIIDSLYFYTEIGYTAFLLGEHKLACSIRWRMASNRQNDPYGCGVGVVLHENRYVIQIRQFLPLAIL